VAAGDWGATVAGGGGVGRGVGVATVDEIVATSVLGVRVAAPEEIVLGTGPAGGAIVGWLTVAGFSEVTSSLAVGCDEGRAATTVVVDTAGLLFLSCATDAVVVVAPATDPLETDVVAGVLVEGITEGLLGGGTATTAATGAGAEGLVLLTMLLSGITELSFGLGTLLRGVSVLVFSVELEI